MPSRSIATSIQPKSQVLRFSSSDLSENPNNFFTADCGTCKANVYRFVENPQTPDNPGRTVYAVWSPSNYANRMAINTSSEVKVPVPFGTIIATQVRLKPGDEDGERATISNFVTENGILKLKIPLVTESPIFLIIGENLPEAPIECPGITSVEPISCDAMRVNWANNGYDGVRLYYVRQSDMPDPANFDIATARFSGELWNTPTATWTSAVITGLTPETDYWFFVVGLERVTNGNVVTEVASNAGCSQAGTTPRCYDFCWTWIQSDWLSHQQFPTRNAFDHLNIPDFCPWNCDNLYSPAGDYWTFSFNNPSANTITINLPGFWNVDMIYLYDVNDIGLFIIQYQDVNGTWHLIDSYLTVKYLDWTILANFAPHDTPIDKLRFTMLTNGNVGEILLCAQPLFGLATESEGTIDEVGYPRITPVNVFGESATTMDIKWDAMPMDDAGNTFFKKYVVRYGTEKDDRGYLVDPHFKEVESDGFTSEIRTSIEKLGNHPHFIHVSVANCDEEACKYSIEVDEELIGLGSHNFETAGDEKTKSEVAPFGQKDILISPNPTNSRFTVYLPEKGFAALELFNLNGKTLQSIPLNEEALSLQISMEALPPGIYFLLAKKKNGEQVYAKVIRQ